MPHHAPSTLPQPKQLSPLGRGLAAAQLAKETLTIVLLGVPLLVQQPVLVPAALPGVVLFLFRSGIVLGQVPRRAAAAVWWFTLLDEAWGIVLYLNVVDEPTRQQLRYLMWSYGLGLAFTLAALTEIYLGQRRERRHLRALMRATWR